MQTADIVLLGGGIAGLATAYGLAELGARRVVLLEREPELARQSTNRSAALVRTASDEELLEDFALESARFLAAPPRGFADRPLVDRRGVVLLGRGRAAPAGGFEHRAPRQAHVRALSAAELARRAPHVVHRGEDAWLYPDEGQLDVDLLIGALVRGARGGGVELATSADVRTITRTVAGFELVLADGRRLGAGRLVLASGGWSAELGRRAGSSVELAPTRRHLFVTLPLPGIDPAAPIAWNERTGFYSRPEAGGLLASACDTLDAEPAEHGVDAGMEAAFRAKARENLRGAELGLLARAWSGTRTFARDHRFVLGADPTVPGLFWAAGLGGHGMTCGVAAGRLCARLVLGLPADERFVRGFAPARIEARTGPVRTHA